MAGKTLLLIGGATAAALAAAWAACPQTAEQAHSATSEVMIDLPIEEAWSRLRDLALAHNYVPGIIRTEITTPDARGPGASRRVYTSESDYINETVAEWVEGQGFTLTLHRDDGSAPVPFGEASFTYRLETAGDASTRLFTELRYTLPGGCLGNWLGGLLLGSTIQGRQAEVAERLKAFYEGSLPPA